MSFQNAGGLACLRLLLLVTLTAVIAINLTKKFLYEAKFVKDNDDFDELEIDFMGGEPFMNFSLIKEIVEWLEGINWTIDDALMYREQLLILKDAY